MKVVLITNYWKNSAGGGIKIHLSNLVDELKKSDNIEVTVVFREGEDSENVKVSGSKLVFAIKTFFVLKKLKPQVIHSHGPWYCLLAGYFYKKICGAKLIHTFLSYPSKLSFIGTIVMEFLLNNCDYVTFVSKGLENEMNPLWALKYKSKREITYAGVKIRVVTQNEIDEFRKRFNIDEDSTILLGQGLTAVKGKAKGAKILMESVKKIKGRCPKIRLILTRAGQYSNELKEWAKKEGISDAVIFTGDISNPFVPLKICDIYTHISLEDGLPISILEAMSLGKPIIATSIGGIPEAIENKINGILVEPDSDEISKQIIELIENKELAKKLGQEAKKTAEEKFTWDISVKKIMDIYFN